MKYKLILLLTVIILLVIIHYIQKHNSIPKQIWTYWGQDTPPIIISFIDKWKRLNPSWRLTLVTQSTLQKYIKNEQVVEMLTSNRETPQFSSDLIRCLLLYEYGGVWLDANILLLKPLDWVLKLQRVNRNIEYVGYYIPNFTNNLKFPIVESWFMSCVPKSPFMFLLKEELIKAYGEREEYVKNMKRIGVDLQNIPHTLQSYLCIHVAMQYILQILKYDRKHLELVKSTDDAFKFHGMVNWKSKQLIQDLTSNDKHVINKYQRHLKGMNLIKLRGEERNQLRKVSNIPENSIMGQLLS